MEKTIADIVSEVTTGSTIDLPSGQFIITKPIEIKSVDNVTIRGNNTTIIYDGPENVPGIFVLARCGYCKVSGVMITTRKQVESGILVTNLPGVDPTNQGRISTANKFENCQVAGLGKMKKCLSIDSFVYGGTDGNNEFHKFIDVTCTNYTQAGFHVRGGQIHRLVYDGCVAYADPSVVPWDKNTPRYGMDCEYGIYFRWASGSMAWNNCDFNCRDFGMQVMIDGHNSEHSKAFFKINSPDCSVSIRNIRWDGVPERLPEPDGNRIDCVPVVSLWTAGIVELTNANFTAYNGVQPYFTFGYYDGESPEFNVRVKVTVQNPIGVRRTTAGTPWIGTKWPNTKVNFQGQYVEQTDKERKAWKLSDLKWDN